MERKRERERAREREREMCMGMLIHIHTLISMHICADRLVRVNKPTNFLDYVRLSSPTGFSDPLLILRKTSTSQQSSNANRWPYARNPLRTFLQNQFLPVRPDSSSPPMFKFTETRLCRWWFRPVPRWKPCSAFTPKAGAY